MLTPIEIQGKVFKSGIGYDKKDVDQFSKDLLANYEVLYKENIELNDKINVLSEGLQYYKSIEKTLQKALVLAEKTAEETRNNAVESAKIIEQDAHSTSKTIVSNAKCELDRLHLQTISMVQTYEKYKTMIKQLANTQLELLTSDAFNINIANLEAFEKDTKTINIFPSDKEAILPQENVIQDNPMQKKFNQPIEPDKMKEDKIEVVKVEVDKVAADEIAEGKVDEDKVAPDSLAREVSALEASAQKRFASETFPSLEVFDFDAVALSREKKEATTLFAEQQTKNEDYLTFGKYKKSSSAKIKEEQENEFEFVSYQD